MTVVPLSLRLLLCVYSVHCLKGVCKPVVFSLIKLRLSLCGQIVFLESTFLENTRNCLLRSFFLSLNKGFLRFINLKTVESQTGKLVERRRHDSCVV